MLESLPNGRHQVPPILKISAYNLPPESRRHREEWEPTLQGQATPDAGVPVAVQEFRLEFNGDETDMFKSRAKREKESDKRKEEVRHKITTPIAR